MTTVEAASIVGLKPDVIGKYCRLGKIEARAIPRGRHSRSRMILAMTPSRDSSRSKLPAPRALRHNG